MKGDTIRIVHVSDIHLGGGQNHGKINPVTGVNTRIEDFYRALKTCIDQALAFPADFVLFTGDAFPDATPLPYIHDLFGQEILRLVQADIPVLLLVGNHDQHTYGEGGASLSIYRTLNIPGVIVGENLHTYRVQTRQGEVQIVTLPWITRSMLLTKPETQGLSMAEINQLLLTRLRQALEGEILNLDPAVPAILAAHVMVNEATLGAERLLSAGKHLTIPLSLLAHPAFSYVALGHVHKHQILYTNPPVVYAGSIERVDFSEENEDKGYVLVEIEPPQPARVQFCPLPTRAMKTIHVDLTQSPDPHQLLIDTIRKGQIHDKIVRLVYMIKENQVPQINEAEVQAALQTAHHVIIQAEVRPETPRFRETQIDLNLAFQPMTLLTQYIDENPELHPIKDDILAAAQELLNQSEKSVDQPQSPLQIPLFEANPQPD